ncbi:restriction endonuclease subunit S [Klebsiella quasipneumoniae]
MMGKQIRMLENESGAVPHGGIPVGYKQTEAGIIPEDWEVRKLRDISPSQSVGLVINPSSYYSENGTVPMLVGSHVYENKIIWINANTITEDSNAKLPASRLYAGDLVTVRVGEPGITAVIPKELDQANCASMMIIRKGKNFDSFWLCYLMNSKIGKSRIEGVQYGTAQKQFNIVDAVDFIFPFPPKLEQTAIANVLSDTDALITQLEKLIAKKLAIKTATMQQLLTGRTRLPQFTKHPDGTRKGYKTSELGRVPEDWTVLTYGQIFDFLSTSTNARSDLSHDGEYGYIHYGDIHTKWNNKLDASAVELPKISRKLVCSSFLENGDVIMADASEDYNGIGKSIEICNISNKKIVAGLHTYLLRDKYKQLSDGYRGYLHSNANVKKIIEQLATGMKVFGISKNNLFSVPVPVPSKQEQTAIATILSDMDAELEALEQKLAKVRDIKQGMMQQLLTGRIRLPLEQQP